MSPPGSGLSPYQVVFPTPLGEARGGFLPLFPDNSIIFDWLPYVNTQNSEILCLLTIAYTHYIYQNSYAKSLLLGSALVAAWQAWLLSAGIFLARTWQAEGGGARFT